MLKELGKRFGCLGFGKPPGSEQKSLQHLPVDTIERGTIIVVWRKKNREGRLVVGLGVKISTTARSSVCGNLIVRCDSFAQFRLYFHHSGFCNEGTKVHGRSQDNVGLFLWSIVVTKWGVFPGMGSKGIRIGCQKRK